MRKARHLYRFVIAAAFVAVVGAVPVKAIESFGIGALPANPKADNPRTQSIFVHEIKPGQTVNDSVRVVNNSNEQKTISVYAVDSELSSDGAFACKQAVEPKESVGSWITLAKSEVILKPNTNELVPFTIKVPSSASVGEHNGCIAVQDMKKNEATGNGIVLSFRSALRVVVMVPGEVKASLTVNELKKRLEKDKLIVSPVLHNSGNVSLDTQVTINLKNLLGLNAGSGGGKFPILRDTTSQFNIELDQPFWGGWYWVGGEATYQILQTGAEKNAASAPTSFHGSWQFIAPKPLALLIETLVLVLVAGAVAFTLWKRKHTRHLHRTSTLYRVDDGDDIESVAKRFNVRWQIVAKMNGLKPPYKLTPGQQIKIPKK